jgi:hypothetical protein
LKSRKKNQKVYQNHRVNQNNQARNLRQNQILNNLKATAEVREIISDLLFNHNLISRKKLKKSLKILKKRKLRNRVSSIYKNKIYLKTSKKNNLLLKA